MKWEKVTIFISSTFNDMHAERDYLIKDVFPELREWCEERKIHLVDVDLRWGVTEEDANAKNTVLACLHNIDESRPFFLCFLGQRRGWQPTADDVSQETIDLYPDVKRLVGKHSVTEMEIEHALLAPMRHIVDGKEKPEIPVGHALFYFRKDTYTDELTPAQRKIFTNEGEKEMDTADAELKNYVAKVKEKWTNTSDYDCEWDTNILSPELITPKFKANESHGRLTRFEVNGKPLKELIVAQLKKEILMEFPDRRDAKASTPLEKDLEQQDLFINLNSESFIPRDGDFDALDDYLKNDKNGLFVLTAPAGYGKSMLLANFITQKSKEYRYRFFNRFCGASDLGSQQYPLWKTIFDEANIPCPHSLADLQEELDNLFEKLAERPTVIIIDAINQLPDGLDMLQWLPEQLPAGLKIILSTKEDNTDERLTMIIDGLKDKGKTGQISLSHVKPLENKEEKKKLIREYLRKYLKALDEKLTELICSFKGSANPLYLKILLSELRIFGSFEQLNAQIQKFGATPKEAFEAVLDRLENDTNSAGIDSKRFATALFGLLANARNGLSEQELTPCLKVELPNTDDEKIVQAIRLFVRQVRPFMARREGRIDYFYESFKHAAQERYASLRIRHNQLLVGYFLRKTAPAGDLTFTGEHARDFNELPYHLYHSQNIETLERILGEYLWIRSKLNLTEVDNVAKDYEDYIEQDRNHPLKLIGECLVLSSHILREDKEQLPTQLWGRMVNLKDERIQKLLEQAKNTTKEPWFRPAYQCWTGPGSAQLRTLKGHKDNVISVNYSPDGKMIATVSVDNTCIIWDTKTWRRIITLKGDTEEKNNGNICFSPDGKMIALSFNFSGRCIIWDTKTWKQIITLKGDTEVKNNGNVSFSPDGKKIATIYDERTCIIWDTETWEQLLTLKGREEGCIRNVCFSPDGDILAAADAANVDKGKLTYAWNGFCILWDVKTGKIKSKLEIGNRINIVCFSPDGKMVAVASSSEHCCYPWYPCSVFDTKTGAAILRLEDDFSEFPSYWKVKNVCFSPDQEILAVSDEHGYCILWDTKTWGKIAIIESGFLNTIDNSICFSPSGKIFVTTSYNGSCILWDRKALKGHIKPIGFGEEGIDDFFSSDGKIRASIEDANKIWTLRKTSTGEIISTINMSEEANWMKTAYFSMDRKIIALVSFEKGDSIDSPLGSTCILYDIKTGKQLMKLTGNRSYITTVCFSPDGKQIATASTDNTCMLWNIIEGKRITTFELFETSRLIKYSPDGKTIAAPSSDNSYILWNTNNGEQIIKLKHTEKILEACFSPDGKIIATTSGNTCILWNTADGRRMRTLDGYNMCFSPDGKILALTSFDTDLLTISPDGKLLTLTPIETDLLTIILWDTRTWNKMTTLKHPIALYEIKQQIDVHTIKKVDYLNFSPDGKILISASGHGRSCVLWNVKTYELASKIEPTGACSVTCYDNSLLVLNTLYFLYMENIPRGDSIVTPVLDDRKKIAIRCKHCDQTFDVTKKVLDTVIQCPYCGEKLKVNPFLAESIHKKPGFFSRLFSRK
jgi:WD40 repeat protein